MPSFNLPSKILCKVVNVQRRVGLLYDNCNSANAFVKF